MEQKQTKKIQMYIPVYNGSDFAELKMWRTIISQVDAYNVCVIKAGDQNK